MKEKQLGRKVSPHFLGAVILDSTRPSSTKEVTRFLVIDGQQRLTTFQLLLAAMRDVAAFHQLPNIARLTERCLINPDSELMERPHEEIFKIWPTQTNRDVFCQLIEARSFDSVQKNFPLIYGKTKSGRRQKNPQVKDKLVQGYEYFYSQVNELCLAVESEDQKQDVLMSLFSVLKDDFTVVEIILDEYEDSQEIFNSLNSRGKPLSQSDLLRSYIFMRAEKSEIKRDELYNNYWVRFESKWWDEEVQRGSQKSSFLDLLTRTILSAKLAEPVDVRRVHSEYMAWIEREKPYLTLEDELKDFCIYADAFEQLYGKKEGVLSAFGTAMRVWGTTTIFPLVSYLYADAKITESKIFECLKTLESFVVRRAICGLDNKGYNKFFIGVISKLKKADNVGDELFEILLGGEGDTGRFPSNDDFKQAWISNGLYSRLKPDQLVYIFTRLESAIRSHRAENDSIYMASIEHVMPQKWTKNYPIAGVFVPESMNNTFFYPKNEDEEILYQKVEVEIKKRRSLIHTIGNLTAVTQSLNSAMKDAKFLDKKEYLKESVLAINRYFDSQEDWDNQNIEDRSKSLFDYANKIWMYRV